MSESPRFNLIYAKMQETLDKDARNEPQRAPVAIQHGGEVSRDELDEIARLREIVLETTVPEPISFTTT